MFLRKAPFILTISLVCILNTLYSQVDTSKASVTIEIISLEELLNLGIDVVSKKTQKISEAPAIVTIITDDQIEQLGVQKLFEVLEYVPGFTVHDTYWQKLNTSRGVSMTMYNDKILMLINGIPTYSACTMEYFLDLVPLISIKRIEIIRGPGSTLYGTNAFSAVINVVTKDEKSGEMVNAYLSGGSFRNTGAGLSINDNIGEFIFYFGGTYTNDDGFVKKNFVDEVGARGDNVYEYDISNLFGSLKFQNFTLNTGYMFTRRTVFGPMPRFISANNGNLGTGGRRNDEKLFLNLMYDNKLSEKLNAKLTFHYDFTDSQTDLGTTGEWLYRDALKLITATKAPDYYRMTGWLFLGEAQLTYTLNDNLSFLGGVSYEKRITENIADLFSDYNGERLFSGSTLETGAENINIIVDDVSGYLQVDGKFDKLGYVAGLRATYLGISKETNITPRAGLVYNISKSSSVKALYGEAFRGAGPQEQYYKVPGIIVGADAIGKGLKPERIKTYELALDQDFFERYKLRINGFILNVFDMIARRDATATDKAISPLIGNAKIYDNVGQQKISGVEIELNGYPTNTISFFANFSYKDGSRYDDNGNQTYDFIENMEHITANAGLSFKLDKLTISPNFQYVGDRKGTLVSKPNEMLTVDGFGLLNIAATYMLNYNLQLSFSTRNIFNKEYWYPETSRRNMQQLPGGPGRSIYVKLSYLIGKSKD